MTAKIRLTATAQEIENWKAFFDLLARANVIQLLEVSDNYNNRGNSQYQRFYLEAELLGDVSSVESPIVQKFLLNSNSKLDQC